MSALLRDFKHGIRALRRSPGFTLLAVSTLALGIGATSAIFSLVDAVLFRPLPVRDPGRLAAYADFVAINLEIPGRSVERLKAAE